MLARLLADDDVRALLTPELAVGTMLAALADHGRDALAAPPRMSADLGGSQLTLTAGATPTHYGYRSYDTRGLPRAEQVVVAHSAATGEVETIAVGNLIGPRRTGALGGAAASLLAGPGPHAVAVIGSGVQARNQLWALGGVLDIAEVRIHSPRPARRERLAAHARDSLGLPARAVASTGEAVRDATVVVLATSAESPVLAAGDLAPDVLVHTLGVAAGGRAEIPSELLADAFVTADSPAQHLSEIDPLLPPEGARAIVPLGAVAAGRVTPPAGGRRIYLSRGLAGTEVALLAAISAAADRAEGVDAARGTTDALADPGPGRREGSRHGPPAAGQSADPSAV